MSNIPPEVWQAVAGVILALTGWLIPGPNRRRRNNTTPFKRRSSDL